MTARSAARSTDRVLSARFVLATDLDGTFLGGPEVDRLALYDWINENRDEVGLVFVTGRDPGFIAGLCEGTPVPWPDFVVGDVGTTIAQVAPGDDAPIRPIPGLEVEIARRWNDSGNAVRAALDGHPGLALQRTDFRYRVSYDYDPDTYCRTAEEKVDVLGLDHLISDNRYFDVLPKGVSKGPSLRRLVEHLGLDEERVLAAGDTLNDLSMLECGLKAVAVGGSEPALIDRVGGNARVYKATRPGAAGIAEAMAVYGFGNVNGREANAV